MSKTEIEKAAITGQRQTEPNIDKDLDYSQEIAERMAESQYKKQLIQDIKLGILTKEQAVQLCTQESLEDRLLKEKIAYMNALYSKATSGDPDEASTEKAINDLNKIYDFTGTTNLFGCAKRWSSIIYNKYKETIALKALSKHEALAFGGANIPTQISRRMTDKIHNPYGV